jgi:hypothetical protein
MDEPGARHERVGDGGMGMDVLRNVAETVKGFEI